MENFEQILQDLITLQEQNKALKEELKEKSIIHSTLCTEISQLNERNDELDSENETHYRWWKETTKREMILKNQLDLATQLFREAIKITEHAKIAIKEGGENYALSDIDLLESSFKAFILSQQSLSEDLSNKLSEFIQSL
jgi:cell division septum initiation protein DivIVA